MISSNSFPAAGAPIATPRMAKITTCAPKLAPQNLALACTHLAKLTLNSAGVGTTDRNNSMKFIADPIREKMQPHETTRQNLNRIAKKSDYVFETSPELA